MIEFIISLGLDKIHQTDLSALTVRTKVARPCFVFTIDNSRSQSLVFVYILARPPKHSRRTILSFTN